MNMATYFIDVVSMSDRWSELCDQMYWERNFSDDRCMDLLLAMANEDGMLFASDDPCDVDFYEAYKDTEKGLS